ncbi:MAG: hypothetical protein ACP5I8_16905 [Phycisphaerae bacterium]
MKRYQYLDGQEIKTAMIKKMVSMKKHIGISLIGMAFCGLLMSLNTVCTARPHTTTAARAVRWHGLTVNPQGIVEKDGQPYRGIGANFPGALLRLLVNPDDPSVPRDFKELEAYHIPFVRFPALAAWGTPAQCRTYINKMYYHHPVRYFDAMDKLCAIANKYHVGLIPSLFFTRWANALSGESGMRPWNNPQSRTYRIWTHYTIQMVTRYEHNPAIWGWEMGNEFNLDMDLPDAAQDFSGYKPAWDYTHAQMWKLYARFVHLVRQYDPYHIIEAGNSRPRGNSWHNMRYHMKYHARKKDAPVQWAYRRNGPTWAYMKYHAWKKDTSAQWAYMLKRDNAAFDIICVHEYGVQAPANIARVAALAAGWHKPVFVGEFGASGAPAQSRKLFTAILGSILKAKVPLAAVWAFDKPAQTVANNDYSITPTNDRRFMLRAIEAANIKLRAER